MWRDAGRWAQGPRGGAASDRRGRGVGGTGKPAPDAGGAQGGPVSAYLALGGGGAGGRAPRPGEGHAPPTVFPETSPPASSRLCLLRLLPPGMSLRRAVVVQLQLMPVPTWVCMGLSLASRPLAICKQLGTRRCTHPRTARPHPACPSCSRVGGDRSPWGQRLTGSTEPPVGPLRPTPLQVQTPLPGGPSSASSWLAPVGRARPPGPHRWGDSDPVPSALGQFFPSSSKARDGRFRHPQLRHPPSMTSGQTAGRPGSPESCLPPHTWPLLQAPNRPRGAGVFSAPSPGRHGLLPHRGAHAGERTRTRPRTRRHSGAREPAG